MAAPFVATSRLSNILQMITLSHQTGILRVIRGHGMQRELGQIRFLGGEPVAALIGHWTGQDALGILNTWGECQYAFDELPLGETSDAELPARDAGSFPGRQYPQYPSGPSATSWPAYSFQQSGPLGPLPPSLTPTGTFGSSAASNPQGASYPSGMTQPSLGGSGPHGQPNPVLASLPSVSPEMLRTSPRRTGVAERIDQLPLDRRERMVLLLVDGQRTLVDLARLTRRTEPEVFAVLNHLQALGLVSVGN